MLPYKSYILPLSFALSCASLFYDCIIQSNSFNFNHISSQNFVSIFVYFSQTFIFIHFHSFSFNKNKECAFPHSRTCDGRLRYLPYTPQCASSRSVFLLYRKAISCKVKNKADPFGSALFLWLSTWDY